MNTTPRILREMEGFDAGNALISTKPVKERDTLDLLNLVCELSGRFAMYQTKVLHTVYFEARKELESRLASQSPASGVRYNQDVLKTLWSSIWTMARQMESYKFIEYFLTRYELIEPDESMEGQQQGELEQLRAWKESAMSVMPDYQAIGKALGVKLGESVHDKILPGVERLKGDAIKFAEWISKGGYISTTLPNEPVQLWQVNFYDREADKFTEGQEITSAELYNLFIKNGE